MEELIGEATVEKNGLQKANTALGYTGSMGKYKIGSISEGLVCCTFIITRNNTYNTVCDTYLLQIISPPSSSNELKIRHKPLLLSGKSTISFHARFHNEQIEFYIDSDSNFTIKMLLDASSNRDFTYAIEKLESIPEDCIASTEVQ